MTVHDTSQVIKATRQRLIATFDNCVVAIFTQGTEILLHPAPGKPRDTRYITAIGRTLNAVDNFTYLGCTLSNISKDDGVSCRIFKNSSDLKRFRGNVLGCRGRELALR